MNAQLQQWIQVFQEGVADTNQPLEKKKTLTLICPIASLKRCS